MIKKIYLDMDGVLSDFDAMLKLHWPEHVPHSGHIPKKDFWEKVKKIPNFWSEMPLMPNAKDLYANCWANYSGGNVEILTAPANADKRCVLGKRQWIKNNISNIVQVNFSKAENKWHFAEPGSILIDDKQSNINDWINGGGIGILYKDYETTIQELNSILGITTK